MCLIAGKYGSSKGSEGTHSVVVFADTRPG